ncbi:hypothetical protein [Clostridium botulinum]|uniref:hypothetical protein n=1 Tax=Clostridium botulinum TaxID=1491 RepID=UPI001C9A9243|nr:hypothetical protein [Clostridium botulinum]MBY6811682.1 hypothetical protein [Clostridium botulinum]MBY6825329.1 hypothetical protein [Clostridium botulinum]MBY6835451.1 hypothetical protein [Clostridium botulinum]MBY6973890.1 hypothetical protein [Clostridium botulinum]MCS6105337.1 hypothetical protein [Clostridium botulinum]
MKSGILISKKELSDIIGLINKPSEMSNLFNIKTNIKIYANIEKIDGYALVYLGDELNEMAINLANELSVMNSESDRNEILCKIIKDMNEIKNRNLVFLGIITVLHRMNKNMNRYLLD